MFEFVNFFTPKFEMNIHSFFVTSDYEASYSDLSDAVYKVARSFQGLATAKSKLNEAVKGISNCGSDSTDGVNKVISANSGAAKSLADLNTAFVRATDESNELTGDLNQVTNAFGGVSDAIDTLSGAVEYLSGRIDYESADSLGDIASTLEKITKSLTDVTETFENVTGPEKLFEELSDPLKTFKNALQELYDAVSQLINSLSSKLSKCGLSNDVPTALTDLNGITKRFISDLSQ